MSFNYVHSQDNVVPDALSHHLDEANTAIVALSLLDRN